MKIPEEHREQYTQLNRKLIPANIVLVVLAIVACLAQLLMPLIKITITIQEGSIPNLVYAVMEEDEETSAEDMTEEESMMNMVIDCLKDMPEIPLTISFNPLDLILSKTLTEAISNIALNILPQGDALNEFVNDVLKSLVSGIASSGLITEMIFGVTEDDFGDDATEAQTATQEAIDSILTNLYSGDRESAKTALSDYIYTISGLLDMEVYDEDVEQLVEAFDEIIDTAYDEEGNFSIANLITGLLDSMGDEEEEGEAGEEGEEEFDVLEAVTGFLADPSGYLNKNLPSILEEMELDALFEDSGISYSTIAAVVFIVLGGFPAALWLILAIAAFVHIFTKNKKVGMWYTKLVSIWPCILFFILPLVAISLLPSLVAGLGLDALLECISISVMSSGLVTGICYLLMWAVSIFMCFPNKRKLRRLKKQIKAERRMRKRESAPTDG